MGKQPLPATQPELLAPEIPAPRLPLFSRAVTRRGFIKITGAAGMSLAGSMLLTRAVTKAGEAVVLAGSKSQGLVVGDPARCVGCRRCELACTEYNDGKSQPAIARVKVGRNWQYGPKGAQLGFWRGEGRFGNHRIIQDACQQCPHPVPCKLACPQDAIEVVPPVNARVVNLEKCTGCGMCVGNCPWEMISLDREAGKATKCYLCDGQPQCVEACPTGALRYIPWIDKTKETPQRASRWGYIGTQAKRDSCVACH